MSGERAHGMTLKARDGALKNLQAISFARCIPQQIYGANCRLEITRHL